MSAKGNAKNWTFTWHQSAALDTWPGETTDGLFRRMYECICDAEDLDYFFAGREICPTTGSKHLQGYAHFDKKKRLTQLKKIHEGIHWEVAEKDWEHSWIYCTKEDPEPFTFGELPEIKNNGEREKNRWIRNFELAKQGRLDEIDPDISLRCYGAIKAIARDHQKKPASLPDYHAEWVWGRSGSGKSTLARKEHPDCYPKECNKWWCGYQNEEIVLVEDIDPDNAKYIARHCKIWGDKFAFIGESKGGSWMIRPKKVIFTSQYTIEECFNERDAVAIRRRCKVRKIENFQEVPDDSAPNENAPAGTAPTFCIPETPLALQRQTAVVPPNTQVDTQELEEEYREEMHEIKKGRMVINLCDEEEE